MEGVKPRVRAPKTASAGEVVTLKTLISHPMESGQRKDGDGNTIPQHIINRFVCSYNDEVVIDVQLSGAVSTNPYFEFDAVVNEAGSFKFEWYDDDGDVYEEIKDVAIG